MSKWEPYFIIPCKPSDAFRLQLSVSAWLEKNAKERYKIKIAIENKTFESSSRGGGKPRNYKTAIGIAVKCKNATDAVMLKLVCAEEYDADVV